MQEPQPTAVASPVPTAMLLPGRSRSFWQRLRSPSRLRSLVDYAALALVAFIPADQFLVIVAGSTVCVGVIGIACGSLFGGHHGLPKETATTALMAPVVAGSIRATHLYKV